MLLEAYLGVISKRKQVLSLGLLHARIWKTSLHSADPLVQIVVVLLKASMPLRPL